MPSLVLRPPLRLVAPPRAGLARRAARRAARGAPPARAAANRARPPRLVAVVARRRSPPTRSGAPPRPRVLLPAPRASLDLDRGSSPDGAGAGNADPSAACPVCRGTGWKPCGQCDGTGVNQEDLYGGKFRKGDQCWLCAGKKRTMCGNCVDLTDTF
jgi:hypothetical protein